EWKKAHATLRSDYGDSSKIRKRDRRVHELLGKVESSYKEMATGADQLLTQLEQNPMPPFDSITKNIDRILSYEAQYSEDMNKVVLQFDQHASAIIVHLNNIQLFLFVISLLAILVNLLGIFIP